jgi:hypothetical protein
MFLKHPETQEFCDYTQTGFKKWGQTHDGKSTLLNNANLDRMFLQGNKHLVWDIWAPLLDPLASDDQWFTPEGTPWGECFMVSTLTALNWMITHHFYPVPVDKASETMSQE